MTSAISSRPIQRHACPNQCLHPAARHDAAVPPRSLYDPAAAREFSIASDSRHRRRRLSRGLMASRAVVADAARIGGTRRRPAVKKTHDAIGIRMQITSRRSPRSQHGRRGKLRVHLLRSLEPSVPDPADSGKERAIPISRLQPSRDEPRTKSSCDAFCRTNALRRKMSELSQRDAMTMQKDGIGTRSTIRAARILAVAVRRIGK